MTDSFGRDEPLGLTVHSLPKPEQSATSQNPSGRWKLIVVVLLCSLPMLAAYLAYFVIKPAGRAELGELINPVRAVPEVVSVGLDGKSRPLAGLKGQWLLVSVGSGDCDAECQQRLFLQRQLRETLGKGRERVDWVWVISDAHPVSEDMKKPLADAIVLRVDQPSIDAWLVPSSTGSYTEYLYVVDPLGNAMMRFPAHFNGAAAAKARRDLDRLLRASSTWDGPGR